MTERVMRVALLFALAATLSPAALGQSQSGTGSDPRETQARAERGEEISRLRALSADTATNPIQRVASFRQLALIDQDTALTLAVTLTGDTSVAVALEAVDQLASFVALMGHGGHQDSATPWEAALVEKHTQAVTALRAAARDPRPAVGGPALAALVRLSDTDALAAIRARVQNRTITPAKAGLLCAQASPETGRACLIDLLNSDLEEGQRVAIHYLGARPTEQAMIRNKILFNDKQSAQVRSIAAETLGRYDDSFASYGLAVAADSATPAPVFASVVKAYADRQRYLGKLDAAQRLQLRRAIDSKMIEVRTNTPATKRPQALAPLIQLKNELSE